MRAWTLAFSAGLILCGFIPRIPAAAEVALVLVPGLLAQAHRLTRLPGAFMLGCGWLLWYAQASVGALWPEQLEGVDVWVQGVVWSLPQPREHSVRFEFRIDALCVQPQPTACEFSALSQTRPKVLVNLYQP